MVAAGATAAALGTQLQEKGLSRTLTSNQPTSSFCLYPPSLSYLTVKPQTHELVWSILVALICMIRFACI